MTPSQANIVIDALAKEIENLQMSIYLKDTEIANLKKENEQLNEFLNPTKEEEKGEEEK